VKLFWNVVVTAITISITWLIVDNLIAYMKGRPLGVPTDVWVVFVAAFFGRTIGIAFLGGKAK
jgi:hypothetical protein